MLLLIALLAAPPVTDVVLFDDLLVACHRPGVGWFTGAPCEAAVGGAVVHDGGGRRRTLPAQARPEKCGGTEGYRAFGAGAGGGVLWSRRAKRPALRVDKSPLAGKARAAVQAALAADFAARPDAWRTWDGGRDAKPLDAKAFTVAQASRIGGARWLALRGLGRDVRALVRLAGGRAAVVARDPYGPVRLHGVLDADGDGAAEAWVATGGDTERSYTLVRFIDGLPSAVARMGCGD